jgi:hypothetical protein
VEGSAVIENAKALEPISGTAAVVESYVAWVGPTHSHAALMAALVQAGGNSPQSIFNHCYNSMTVTRFGRLGKFDYLCLLGRLGFTDVIPGSAYLARSMH